jgi:general secretion pathway protein L
VNLLQGKYAVKKQMNMSFAPWRPAAALLAVCVLLHFGLKGWQYFYFKQQVAKLDQQILSLYQQTLPMDPQPSAQQAKQQMEGRLASLRSGGGGGGEMLATLGALSEAVTQIPGTDIQTFIYNKDNSTDLLVLAPSVESLDRIQSVINERGLKAEIQQTNPRESKIEGRLKFTKAGV